MGDSKATDEEVWQACGSRGAVSLTQGTVATMTDAAQDTEYAKILGRDEAASMKSAESFSTRIATLSTSTTFVEVSEISWTEPTALIFKSNRPVFTLLVSVSSDSIETGYVGGTAQQLGKIGAVVLTSPDREMLSRSSTAGKLHIVSCAFERAYAEHVVGSFADLSRAQLFSCLNMRSSLLPSILLRLKSEAMRPGFVSTAIAESLGHAMLVECCHVISAGSPEQEKGGRLTARHLSLIDEYLADLSCEAPSIAAIAALCGMNERYLRKSFRAQMNQSLGQYLRCAQISKARTYLLETELPLKEISYRLGFSTPANFSIAFRGATGETPGQFAAANSARSKTARTK